MHAQQRTHPRAIAREAVRRIARLLAIPALLACLSCSALPSPGRTDRVLFVGNSLTYVGNVPAVFSALAGANGHPVASDMIVEGGATLAQRVADGSVARALDDAAYDVLVLQERGGDLICAFDPDSCVQSRQAILALSALARDDGVRVVLLGTYQSLPEISTHLVREERAAAAAAGIPYIEVSETLRRLRDTAPGFAWFAADGIHPGRDLALLNAVLAYRALFGSLPDPQALAVRAPIYGNDSGLTESLRRADAAPPRGDTPGEVRYPAATLQTLVDAVRGEGG